MRLEIEHDCDQGSGGFHDSGVILVALPDVEICDIEALLPFLPILRFVGILKDPSKSKAPSLSKGAKKSAASSIGVCDKLWWTCSTVDSSVTEPAPCASYGEVDQMLDVAASFEESTICSPNEVAYSYNSCWSCAICEL